MCFWLSLINLISKDTNMIFYLACIKARVKSKRCLSELADIVNASHKLSKSFNPCNQVNFAADA